MGATEMKSSTKAMARGINQGNDQGPKTKTRGTNAMTRGIKAKTRGTNAMARGPRQRPGAPMQ